MPNLENDPRFNPFAEKELGRLQQQAVQEGDLAGQLAEQRRKMMESGELNRQAGLGKAVNDLEDYVLKNTNSELHKLSLDEIGELIKKFDLPYEKEAVYVAADILDRERKKEAH